ncbi:hypothetical protein H4217_008459 [Coemansia sp. RSA 1939]|nr:hypothetical protein H4217_008459 [Coemansia sp. RSA 1939]KAJ2595651.1 hypothetical protein EV177_008094 [Coemansia sp. RSA 1804]
MDAMPPFSSPPRQAHRGFVEGNVSQSGGNRSNADRRNRCPEYRNLSSGSRAARNNEQPWRKRFREQCLDRLNKAREQSFMLHRNLSHISQNSTTPQPNGQTLAGASHAPTDDIDDQEMYHIIQQEWMRFKEEMERQSIEYGDLDDGIIDDIESELENNADPSLFEREYAEWEEYENRIMEEDMVDAEMMELCMDLDLESDTSMNINGNGSNCINNQQP